MRITYDPAKWAATLRLRRIDFRDAVSVFTGTSVNFVDDRRDYGEDRIVTVGMLEGRMVIVVWTQRGPDRHVISMRKANDREQARYGPALR